MTEQLLKLNKEMLKYLCQGFRLPITGTKLELASKILFADPYLQKTTHIVKTISHNPVMNRLLIPKLRRATNYKEHIMSSADSMVTTHPSIKRQAAKKIFGQPLVGSYNETNVMLNQSDAPLLKPSGLFNVNNLTSPMEVDKYGIDFVYVENRVVWLT